MFNRLCMTQNLRSALNTQQLPNSIHPIIAHYEKAFQSDIRGTLLHDNLVFHNDTLGLDTAAPKQTPVTSLSNEYHDLLQRWIHHREGGSNFREPSSRRVVFMTKFQRFGQVYQTATSSPRDSYIIYKNLSSTPLECAGRIRDIFSHTRSTKDGNSRTETFFVIDPYERLSPSHAKFDLYRKYPIVGGEIFYNSFYSPVIISSSDLVCHFARTPQEQTGIKLECFHALPLDKASESSRLHDESESLAEWRHELGVTMHCC